VIVGYLDLESIAIAPGEADPPLVVDSYAVLSLAAPLQLLQAIARRHPKILRRNCPVKDQELSSRRPRDPTKLRHVLIMKELFGVWRPERPNHIATIAFNVKQFNGQATRLWETPPTLSRRERGKTG
jgi:hypothetical protein